MPHLNAVFLQVKCNKCHSLLDLSGCLSMQPWISKWQYVCRIKQMRSYKIKKVKIKQKQNCYSIWQTLVTISPYYRYRRQDHCRQFGVITIIDWYICIRPFLAVARDQDMVVALGDEHLFLDMCHARSDQRYKARWDILLIPWICRSLRRERQSIGSWWNNWDGGGRTEQAHDQANEYSDITSNFEY